jgi:hypothetical protein
MIGQAAKRELEIYIENDAGLYRQKMSILQNVARRASKGMYDPKKAPKLWLYLVDAGAKKYVKEYGGRVQDLFPKTLREMLAREYAVHEYQALKRGEYA